MSTKFPIGAAANEAVQFGLAHWSTVLRYAWAPFLISGVLIGVFMAAAFEPAAFEPNAAGQIDINVLLASARFPLGLLAAGLVAFLTLVIFLTAGIMTSVFDFVVTGYNRPGFFHLRFDGPAKRTFLALLLLSGVGLAITGLSFLAAFAFVGAGPGEIWSALTLISDWTIAAQRGATPPASVAQSAQTVAAFFGIAILIGFIPYFYVNLKLSPMPAGSAVENRLIPFKAFAMTRGHFWSITGAAGLLVVFLIILQMIFGLATGILELASQYFLSQGAALIGGLIGLVVAIASLIFQVFVMAVQGAFQGVIYRRLETGE